MNGLQELFNLSTRVWDCGRYVEVSCVEGGKRFGKSTDPLATFFVSAENETPLRARLVATPCNRFALLYFAGDDDENPHGMMDFVGDIYDLSPALSERYKALNPDACVGRGW
jgi:hypothetical protein